MDTAILQTPFAFLDLADRASATVCEDLNGVARAIHAYRRKRGVRVTDTRVEWVDDDGAQLRRTITVEFHTKDSGATEEYRTALAADCTAEHLISALRATNPTRKAA